MDARLFSIGKWKMLRACIAEEENKIHLGTHDLSKHKAQHRLLVISAINGESNHLFMKE